MLIRRTTGAALTAGFLAAATACGGTTSTATSASIANAAPAAVGGQEVRNKLQQLYDATQQKGTDTVVVYGATATHRDELYGRFEERFPGIDVQAEQLTGPDLTSKINQEFASGKHIADIAHTGSTTMVDFADDGRFQSFDPASDNKLPDRYISPEGLFRADAASIFGILYNTDAINKGQAPQAWDELLDPRWRGKLVLDDPTHMGSTAGALGRLLHDPRYDKQWAHRFAQISQLVATGQSGTNVITGKYGVSPFYPYIFYLKDKKDGAPLGFVFPVQGGNRLSPHYLGLLDQAPHPKAAKLLITWLFTPEAQKLIAKSGDYPTMPEAPGPAGLPQLSELDLLKPIPLDNVNAVYDKALTTIQQAYR